METPDPPNDTPGASKQVVLTPHDIPRILAFRIAHLAGEETPQKLQMESAVIMQTPQVSCFR